MRQPPALRGAVQSGAERRSKQNIEEKRKG